jgi:hypothetical protein
LKFSQKLAFISLFCEAGRISCHTLFVAFETDEWDTETYTQASILPLSTGGLSDTLDSA